MNPKETRLWIVDKAIAYIENGAVTLQIDKPTRHMPPAKASHVADKIWFAGQMRELEIARQRCETKEIPLTDRRRRSSIRLGGGFMITQGKRLVVPQRTSDAPRRPGVFCECGGIFEYIEDDPPDVQDDYIASLLKESQEIAILRNGLSYVPQLAPAPSVEIGFQPPGTLNDYNVIIEKEVKKEAEKASISFVPSSVKKFWIKILEYDKAVKLQFGYSPQLSVEITAEPDTSSLECVGVLSFPENIDRAVHAFEEAEGRAWDVEIDEEFEYWDTEVINDNDGKPSPLNRDIHLIDFETGEDTVWFKPKQRRERIHRSSNIWKELSAIKLGKSEGRFASEKLEKALKMHCPVPRLQPLITL
jgi:hypothetical protein